MAVQFCAACLVFKFIFYSGHRRAWLLIVAALMLMAAETFIFAVDSIGPNVRHATVWSHAIVTLLVSLLFLGGIALIGPAIRRRYAERTELGASMAVMENLLAHSPSAIAVRNLEGKYQLVNDAYERAFGLPREQIIGRTVEQVLPPDFAQRTTEYDAAVIKSGEPIIHEHEAPLAQGDGMLLSVRFPVRDPDGDIVGVGSIGTDVTETHRVRQSLQIQQDRYERATEAAQVGVWEWNLLTGEVYFAPNLERMLGCKDGEHITHIDQWYERLEPGQQKTFEAYVEEYLAGQRYEEEVCTYSVRLPGGRVRWFEMRSEPVIEENGKVIRLIGTDTEITLRRQIEQHAKEREALLNTILENLPVGILIKDRDLRFESANRTFLDWYGVELDQLRGKHNDEIDDFQTDVDYDLVRQQEFQVLETGRNIERLSSRKFADGQPHVVRITKFPIHDEHGAIAKIGSVSVDLTEQIEIQEELKAANRRLDAANRAKSEFLAHMSHELRTPLNSVIGFSEMMKTETLGSMGNPIYVDYAGHIVDSASHLLNVINDILDISKIEAGEFELDESEVNLQLLITDAMTLSSSKAMGKTVNVSSDVPTEIPKLLCDERMIKQVVINLLSNALKFTPDGGEIVVTAKCDPDRHVLLSVRDTGIGMSEQDIPRALQPFEQVRHSAKLTHMGTGLGLSLSKKMVELHGGELFINSQIGMGTAVTIMFPEDRTIMMN